MRVAVLYPAFLGGGAEAVCAWICQVLAERYDVTLVTCSRADLARLDEEYGTSLSRSRLKVHVVGLPVSRAIRGRLETSLSAFALRQFTLMRHYQLRLRGVYDLAISAFNEMDFGERGIQYVHFPMFGRGLECIRRSLGHPDSWARRLYREALRRWSAYSQDRMTSNLTFANSRWTAEAIRRVYGIESHVLYPPVIWQEPVLPWDEREDAVVVVSRIVPEKRIERAIEIVAALRRLGFDLSLHLVGGSGDRVYEDKLRRRYAGEGWIRWQPRMARQEYQRFLGRYKYGLHTRENEQFGIGIAEMVVAGMIPFVPASGGQVEVLGATEELCWQDADEAVQRMARVLREPLLQAKILGQLAQKEKTWGIERFRQQLMDQIESFLAGRAF